MSATKLQEGDHTFTHKSLAIHYTVCPAPADPLTNAPLIIYTPGWGIGVAIYRYAFKCLEKDVQIIYLEPRGTDRSSRPQDPDDMSSRQMASDLEAFRVHLGLNTIKVLGHSAGGCTALAYAILYPRHCAKLCLVASVLLGHPHSPSRVDFMSKMARARDEIQPDTDEKFRDVLMRVVDDYFYQPSTGVPRFLESFTTPPSLWAHKAFYAANEKDGWKQADDLGQVEAQTLVVVGREDRVCDVDVSRAIHNGVRGSKLVVLDECGHFPWVEKEAEFFECLREFLRE